MQGSERLGGRSKEEGDALGFFGHQGGGKTGVRAETFFGGVVGRGTCDSATEWTGVAQTMQEKTGLAREVLE